MTRATPRAGFTLVELVLSIVLLLVVLGIASLSTRRLLAVQSRTASTDTRRTALTDALQTFQRLLATAEPRRGDLRVASDSVLELVHDLGMTTVCRAAGDTLVVTQGADTVPWASTLPRGITTDDQLRIWHDADERWVPRRVLAVTPAGGACGDSTLAWPASGSQRLVLDSTTTGLRPGVVVRVQQRERWSMVRGSDAVWSLSLATWDAARRQFATPQPLLAPIASPTAHGGPGFSVRALDSLGTRLADSLLARTRLVQITLRMATAASLPPIADSVRVHVGAP